MLRSSILFSCFILFLSFQLSAAEGFLKNNGHIRNASALFVKDDGAFQFFLRQRGFSYQFTSVMQGDDHQMRSFIRNKGLLANDFAVHTHRVDIDLVGGNPNPSVIANKPVASKHRHSREEGKWLELYEGVTYKDVYNGIDLVFGIVDGHVKYDFVVSPGADPSQIKLAVSHHDGLSINEQGDLVIRTSLGDVTEMSPVSFQGNRTI
jgi:hypothetical protein